MFLQEQHLLYELAYTLVVKENFNLLHINKEDNEIWLEKVEHKKSKVIRLLHKGFDWKNHLKTDVARVFQKTKAIKKLLTGKTIDIYNVYISTHQPVDSWEELKRPMLLKEKNPPVMNVYYISLNDPGDEIARLKKDIDIQHFEFNVVEDDQEAETMIQQYKLKIASILYAKQEAVKSVFSFGKPFLTYILIALNVMMFAVMIAAGSSTDPEHLIRFGAKFNPLIIEGEWWRIISSMFLHSGFIHILMNMVALYYLGIIVERIYGSWRFMWIYLLAGIGGGLASFAFSVYVSVGASGAIFGLFGALLFFGLIHKKIFMQTMGRGILTVIGINIAIGLTIPQIDMSAHIGGLITGFLAAAICYLPKKHHIGIQVVAALSYIGIIGALVIYGLNIW